MTRACALLASFDLDEPRLTLGQLAERTGLPKPTVHRLASSLEVAGFLTQGDDGRYGLGFRLFELGAIVREQLDVVRACSTAMKRLAAATGETVLLAQVDWASKDLMIVDRLSSTHPLSVASSIGRRSRLAPGCLGKALLMGLPTADRVEIVADLELPVRTGSSHTDRDALLVELARQATRGYATEEGEFFEGVSGVGAPAIYDGRRPLAAVGVVGPTARLATKLDEIGVLVAALAAELHLPARPVRA